jgi:asparagine synthetase B (glutamine-hydrolysing)
MCGFAVVHADEVLDDRHLRSRGPDKFGMHTREGLTFRHYLLHVTGEVLPQPMIDKDVVCVFNGEIYNQPFQRSDGECLIPLYREFGPTFARRLDGEFAIALYDFKRRLAVFATDAFGTKPLWTRGLRAASYGSCIDGSQVPANTIVVQAFEGAETRLVLRAFDFGRQHKTSFDDWTRAFRDAVAKRARPGCFIGLSAGYDSGAIAACLLDLGVEFAAYSLLGNEDPEILERRRRIVGGAMVEAAPDDLAWCRTFLKTHVEDYSYAVIPDISLPHRWMTDDSGAQGSCLLYRRARADGRFVTLAGQGADEILADYPFWPAVSTLRGRFPKHLEPWPNFFGGCQRAFLAKEEHVAGAFGIEARYPFLDPAVVQEFLWLSADLKNSRYKAPIDAFLTSAEFPYAERAKTGFSATTG